MRGQLLVNARDTADNLKRVKYSVTEARDLVPDTIYPSYLLSPLSRLSL